MNNERKCHVLLLYRTMIPSIRLCGHCQMEELAKQGKVEYRARQGLKVKCKDLNWADVVLLGRLDCWYEYQLTKELKEAGKYLIYIIDDDLLNIPPEISSAAYYWQKEIQGYIRGMIEMSDAILSPSPILLEKYAINGRKAIQIEEPAIDPVPYKPHDPNKPVKIGFAGSIDRTSDIESILRDVLIRIKQEFGSSVQFEFFGAIPSFANEIDAKCIPYCNSYDEYRKTLNSLEWDIGLAPMPDTPFHACKHYNKFVEYAAAGIVGVFSDIQPYTRLRKAFGWNLLCRNDSTIWCEELAKLIKYRDGLETYRKQIVQLTEKELSIQAVTDEMGMIVLELPVSSRRHISKKRDVMAIKLRGRCHRVYTLFRKYGIKLPKVFALKVVKRIEK